jgi:hypothetical protein
MRLTGFLRAACAAATMFCVSLLAPAAWAATPSPADLYGGAPATSPSDRTLDRFPALAPVRIDPVSLPSRDLDLLDHNAADAEAGAIARDAAETMIESQLLGDAAGALDVAHIARIGAQQGGDEWRCLARAIYFEARGEPIAGQVAVAEVILNRVDSPRYPDTVCAVVLQGSERPTGCQFSYNCDGKPNVVRDERAFDLAGRIAHVMLSGRPRTLTGAATHFHTRSVNPGWARRLVRITRIGAHVFYRYPIVTASN